METKFWIVDTFSEKRFCGVPSAVFFVDKFDDEVLLQNIAMEINTPETIFIQERTNGAFEAVCYTPTKKGLFFGNALYASSKVINETMKLTQFSIVCGIRSFLVDVSKDGKTQVRFSTIELEKVSTPVDLSVALNNELVVSLAECKDELVVEVRSPSRLFDLSPNVDMLARMGYSSFAITADTHFETDLDYDFFARVFAPKLGLYNDIISPIACTKLSRYWADRIGKTELTASGRNGKVYVKSENEYTYITGNCIISSVGEMFIP